jgi:hypothetical protein
LTELSKELSREALLKFLRSFAEVPEELLDGNIKWSLFSTSRAFQRKLSKPNSISTTPLTLNLHFKPISSPPSFHSADCTQSQWIALKIEL